MAVEIIAEAAQGYEGDPTLASLLAEGAATTGADALKFQLVYADELATPDYQHYGLFRSLEMPPETWRGVVAVAKRAGMRCYFDVFGEQSLHQAHELGADGVKIHSTDFFHAQLVDLALKRMPRVFVSLGGITPDELDAFLVRHRLSPEAPVCFLYGFQADPTPLEMTHLRRLAAWQRRFAGYQFGFMDHVDGDSPEAMMLALLSLPLGVVCIEKHLTLDRALALEDYVSGLAPAQFGLFVRSIRRLERALGSESLELSEAERAYRRKAMKTVVASRILRPGDVLTQEAVSLKRCTKAGPGTTIYCVEEVLGRRVTTEVQANEPLTREMVA